MTLFDLDRFREVAFWSGAPDHPLATLADAEKMIAGLSPTDPAAALGELTAWVKSMNESDAFTPERRTRILFLLDEAARRLWRALGQAYLAPDQRPLKKDGDANILRAMFDSASELTNGFGIALDAAGDDSPVWLEKNVSRIFVRNMRWLGRRLALAYMLHLGVSGALWERMHRLYGLAERRKVARTPIDVFEGNRQPSSVRQEYVRALLLELALPEGMTGRQIELAYRVTGRVAQHVKLEEQATSSTPFGFVPAGDSRPMPAARLSAHPAPAPLFVDTSLALPKLRAGLERDMGRDPADADTLYSSEFTLGERFAMMNRLLDHWGMDPPRRRAKRVSLASPARIIHGYDKVVEVLPAPAQGPEERKRRPDLQLKLDDTTLTLSRAKLRAAARIGPARVIDASNGGLGLALRRGDARWAAHDALVAVLIEPGKDWVVGVVRRIFSIDDEVRLGVQVLSTTPHVLALGADVAMRESVWEEAVKHESSFGERYRKGIWLAKGDMLLEPRLASRGTQFDVPQARGRLRVRVSRVLHDGDGYQRVLFEKLD
jgi:hypothetical protein